MDSSSVFNTRKYPLYLQFVISIGLVLLVASLCHFSNRFLDYRVVALLLLMTASIIAMLFDILPVLAAAVLSAVIWNFLFIPPLYTFHIETAEDVLMFLLYFIIALVNAVLTFKIREAEGKARDKEEKENAIRLYDTLFSSLSHELKTPIATIIGSVDTLQDGKGKLSEQQTSQLLLEMEKAGIRLNRQVENLLNMSRLESGMLQPKLDWSDINELIFSVIQKLEAEYHRKIQFQPDESLPFFKIDAGLMEQVLHNLLHNSLRYTPMEAFIKVQASYENSVFRLQISDSGPGFPEQEVTNVFQKFYKSPHSRGGGIGLGLSIVKGFVLAHNGNISLIQESSKGACFLIELPAETSFLNRLKNE